MRSARNLWQGALLASLSIVFVLADPPGPPPDYPDFSPGQRAPYAVERVVDANTIAVRELETSVEVDLTGVRVPPTEESRAAATAALERLLHGETVYLVAADATPDPDRESDTPARAGVYRSPDGLFVNLELIRQGYCKVDSQPDFPERELFEAYQHRARLAQKGVWNPNPPRPEPRTAGRSGGDVADREKPADKPSGDENLVWVTRSGKKYHRRDCPFWNENARQIPLVEAAQKYGPCGRCKPPPPGKKP